MHAFGNEPMVVLAFNWRFLGGFCLQHLLQKKDKVAFGEYAYVCCAVWGYAYVLCCMGYAYVLCCAVSMLHLCLHIGE